MSFRLHDSLTDATVPLPARTPDATSLYVCGPTVYGYIHVGNARPPVVFDVLVRHLEAQGRRVQYVRNYTDIDDKIIAVANATGDDPRAVAERFIAAYREDTAALGCRPPTAEPRVSEHLPHIIAHVEALLAKGFAYVTDEGDVYYDTARFADYGKLSKRDVAVGRAEFGRGKVGDCKRHECDFALWKRAKAHEPEGARWPSPWGDGRPGWHIECSAMSHAILGHGFDLHGGGMDLKFPHHENEIAQSEAVYDGPMAGAWMHNGFIEVDLERGASFAPEVAARLPGLYEREPELRKISKSDRQRRDELAARADSLDADDAARLAVYARKVQVGEWFQLRALLSRVDGEAVRLWILGTHYRAPLGFEVAEEGGTVRLPPIEAAEKRLEYFYDTRMKLAARRAAVGPVKPGAPKPTSLEFFVKALADFDAALDDDLNTAGALDPLSRAFSRANELCDQKRPHPDDLEAAERTLVRLCSTLGVADRDPEDFFARVTGRRIALRGLVRGDIDALVKARTEARAQREFARADEIRTTLTAMGIELRDGASDTTWRAV